MKKIVLFCNTESLQVYKLCVSVLKEKFGRETVGKSNVALGWELDQVSDAIMGKFYTKLKNVLVLRNEWLFEDGISNLGSFLYEMNKKGCDGTFIIDTLDEERIYTGTDLKRRVLQKLEITKMLIENVLNN